MARRRAGTKAGARRRTARRAYRGLARRTRRVRRTTYAFARRRTARAATGIMSGASGRALRECAWITGGGALGIAADRWMPEGVLGMQSSTAVGAAALAWGIAQSDAKPIYLGFGAIYPAIQNQIRGLIG